MQKLRLTLCLLLLSLAVQAQRFFVEGAVTDEKGQPVQGALVLLKGFQNAVTNEDGYYRINDIPAGPVYQLSVSHLGYEPSNAVSISTTGAYNFVLKPSIFLIDEMVVKATRAGEGSPIASSTLNKDQIDKSNLGFDVPMLLDQTPSVVVTSDAGNGVGYTGIRIRGSDQTRINVTINGIALNDAESQNVFWVDLPDLASSANDIQIQRGVGTSTNGAGAFGASINLQTSKLSLKPYLRIDNSYGSFNTLKNNLQFGTGLIANRWYLDGRLSQVRSDGYIDRSASRLNSMYLSGGYVSDKTSIKYVMLLGKEVTQQAWYGTPSARINNDSLGIENYIALNGLSPAQAENLRNSDRRYNHYLYNNQVDDYTQNHYQLHFNHQFSPKLNYNLSLHYTRGKGYYEQFQDTAAAFDDTALEYYGLEPININGFIIDKSNLIRRRWLDNHYYGFTTAFIWQASSKFDAILGGAWNQYRGKHFGEVIWASNASNGNIRHRYYDNDAVKDDANVYLKLNYKLGQNIRLFADLQYRFVAYQFLGFDTDGTNVTQTDQLNFFNPKFGASWQISKANQLYAYYGIANREPNRNDYTESSTESRPKHETLRNLELGYRFTKPNFNAEINAYHMDYRNELVLTGQLNDVGAQTRVNVPKSYRMGLEFSAAARFWKAFQYSGNLTLSRNIIPTFTEYVDDWDNGGSIVNTYQNTNIAFSPGIIAASELSYDLFKALQIDKQSLEIALIAKYVGRQYLDNTGAEIRSLNPYGLLDFRLHYQLEHPWVKRLAVTALVRNLTNNMYSANGWVYRYSFNGNFEHFDGLYPQAGINFMLGLSVTF